MPSDIDARLRAKWKAGRKSEKIVVVAVRAPARARARDMPGASLEAITAGRGLAKVSANLG
jgi:hypothetical protein